MKKKIEIVVPPEVGMDENNLKEYVARKANISRTAEFSYQIIKRSIDARSTSVKIRLSIEVFVGEVESVEDFKKRHYQDVKNNKQVIVVGAGPAGLFAALRLIELGIKYTLPSDRNPSSIAALP